VAVNTDTAGSAGTHVGYDALNGSALVAAHLRQLGHRDVAYVAGPARLAAFRNRAEGFVRSWREEGSHGAAITEVRSDGSRAGGIRAAMTLLSRGWTGTAIACFDDLAAIGVITGLIDAGMRVPEDVSVAGFGNLDAGEWIDPPLTTVRPPTAEIATLAVRRLVDRLHNPGAGAAPDAWLPMTLVPRATTAPVRTTCGSAEMRHSG
jgi:DNA-binding LacI/PurR family transcriptional regulator